MFCFCLAGRLWDALLDLHIAALAAPGISGARLPVLIGSVQKLRPNLVSARVGPLFPNTFEGGRLRGARPLRGIHCGFERRRSRRLWLLSEATFHQGNTIDALLDWTRTRAGPMKETACP